MFNEAEPEAGHKIYKTNQTEIDFPQSHSEKTITMSKGDEKMKEANKTHKTCKKTQSKKASKFSIEHFESSNQYLTTRKSSVKKHDLKNLLRRTEKLLMSYQKR